jgi:hypothetical protein
MGRYSTLGTGRHDGEVLRNTSCRTVRCGRPANLSAENVERMKPVWVR